MPGFLPGMTQGSPGVRGKPASSRSAATAGTEALPWLAASFRIHPNRSNSASVRKRSRLRAGYLTTGLQGLVPSGAKPHPSARVNICDSMYAISTYGTEIVLV